MEQFPDLVSFASVPLDDVLRAWEGFGYCAWARNLVCFHGNLRVKFHGVFNKLPEVIHD